MRILCTYISNFYIFFILQTPKPSASRTTRNKNWSSQVVEITVAPHTVPVPYKRWWKQQAIKKWDATNTRYSTRSQATTINKDNEWDWHQKNKTNQSVWQQNRRPGTGWQTKASRINNIEAIYVNKNHSCVPYIPYGLALADWAMTIAVKKKMTDWNREWRYNSAGEITLLPLFRYCHFQMQSLI